MCGKLNSEFKLYSGVYTSIRLTEDVYFLSLLLLEQLRMKTLFFFIYH